MPGTGAAQWAQHPLPRVTRSSWFLSQGSELWLAERQGKWPKPTESQLARGGRGWAQRVGGHE